MKLTTPLFCAALLAACANIVAPTAVEADRLADARAQLTTAPDRASIAAEELLTENPDLREARLVMAEASLNMARSPEFSSTQFHLIDAARYFDEALEDADDEQFARELRLCAEAHHDLGEWAEGSAAARRSAAGFLARKGQANMKEAATSRLVSARCDYRLFVDARRAEMQDGEAGKNGVVPVESETLALANVAAEGFQKARLDYPTEATTRLAEIAMWLGRNAEVVRTYESGLMAWPAETGIHDAYIGWMCDNGQHDALVGAYRRFVREKPDAPVLRWFEGRAIYERADRLRREGNFQGAITVYQKSRDAFAAYLAVAPQHRDATNQWQALCDLSMARCAKDTGDLSAAAEHLFRAGETSPLATEYVDGQPQLSDSYGNHFIKAAFAIHVDLTQAPEDALARTLAFNEEIVRRHPDQWGFVYNNAALAARDLGVQVSNQGDDARAMELWERSYRHYEKAVALSPDDARIVNDCGLMLIYHLDRDLDRARKLFDRAIEIGTAQLEELPADADPQERQRLEEAVGDAWQNIAVLEREHNDAAFEDYREFCEQAVKYYPYQRREAAALLRNKGAQALASTARAALSDRLSGSGSSNGQGSAAEALKKARPKIDEFAAAGNFDGALTELDKLGKDCKDYAPYHALRGEMNWKLGNQARDSGRRGVELFYQDAARAFQRAVELDAEPVAPRRMLAQAQYDAGDTAAAAETLSSLLLHKQSQGGGEADEQLAVHTLRANAAARAYAAKKQNEEDDPQLLTAARTSMRWLEQKGEIDQDLVKLWATTEQWAGAPAEAVNVYVRASERAPDDFALLDLVVNTAASVGQLPLAVEALAKRDDAGTVWYHGKALYYLAGDQRQSGKAADAMKTLDLAKESFASSMQKNAGYAASCEQWIAMCIGKQGNIALNVDEDLDKAEQLLLEAARRRPDGINEDLGLLETTKRGILGLVDRYYRKNDLKKLATISLAAAEVANSDVDLLNNAGLFARDYGNALERGGNKDEAMKMYEASYKAYTRAQQIDPSNVRLRNDCALIAIYHLERDWDLVKRLLDAAIADGDKTLEESPPENAELKQQLEEAVGDCYENLALWHIKHSKDGNAAKAAAVKSQDYYPGSRRPGARRHIQAAERLLQGK